jgi:hypothetical protein
MTPALVGLAKSTRTAASGIPDEWFTDVEVDVVGS